MPAYGSSKVALVHMVNQPSVVDNHGLSTNDNDHTVDHHTDHDMVSLNNGQ